MFKRILLPVDGSEQSLRAASTGVALAAQGEHQAVGLEVLCPPPSVTLAADALVHDDSSHTARAIRKARNDLAEVAVMAKDANVAFADHYVFDHRPYTAIIAAARSAGCDLIVIGAGEYSFGHGTQLSHEVSLLIHCAEVPVLVCP
jgi:nucleotide-binding universal stress UspA family protein